MSFSFVVVFCFILIKRCIKKKYQEELIINCWPPKVDIYLVSDDQDSDY